MQTHTFVRELCTTAPIKLISLALCLMLSACTNNSMQDLVSYTQKINARPATRVDSLSLEPTWTEPVIYDPAGRRDPFQPLVTAKAPLPSPEIPPPPRHPSEELENYPLDTLRMVGTLEHQGATLGLVRAPDGIVHQVRSGNYLGHNNGKVIAISENGIDLSENVLERNSWQDRPARIALASTP